LINDFVERSARNYLIVYIYIYVYFVIISIYYDYNDSIPLLII